MFGNDSTGGHQVEHRPQDRPLNLTWIVGIFILALAYRGLCFAVLAGEPLLLHPVVDAGQHLAWAQRIVAGDFLGHGPDDVFKAPLYAYFLAAWIRVWGSNIALLQWLQYLMGALSCVMATLLASRLLGRQVGIITGIMSALYAPYVFFESQLLTPALSIFLDLALLLVLLPRGRAPSPGRLLAGGLLLGLSAGVRPDVLVPAGLVALFLLWRAHTGTWRLTLTRAACLAAGAAMVILPITLRNARLTGEFIPLSSYAGINFYTGNSAQADGVSAVPVGLLWERLVSRVPQPVLEQPARASRWWLEQAWKEIAQAPGPALARLGRKALAFANAREFRNNICYHFLQERAWPLRLPFLQWSLIFPLALVGLIALGRRREPASRFALEVILIWVGGFLAVGLAFFVTARYRITAAPLLMVAAGYALVQGTSDYRGRRWGALGWKAGIFLAAGLLVWPHWLGRPQSDWVRDYVNLGNARLAPGDEGGAEQAWRQALTLKDDADAHLLLARLLLKRQHPVAALSHLTVARRLLPESPDLLLASAQACLAAQKPEEARRFLQQLLDLAARSNLWPKRQEWATAHLLLADLEPEAATRHWDQAWSIHARTAAEYSFLRRQHLPRVLETFRQEANSKPWEWYAQANYGMGLLETGHPTQALGPLRRAAALEPGKEGIRLHLARALVLSGQKSEALQILDQLLNTLPPTPLRQAVQQLKAQLTGGGG